MVPVAAVIVAWDTAQNPRRGIAQIHAMQIHQKYSGFFFFLQQITKKLEKSEGYMHEIIYDNNVNLSFVMFSIIGEAQLLCKVSTR